MTRQILVCILSPVLLIFSSFTNDRISNTEYDATYPQKETTNKDFLLDAYNFRLRNNLPISDYYYDVLEIDNPTTPDWVKQQAIAPPPVVVKSFSEDVPLWIRCGQLMKESSSYYNADGSIKYVNKTRGGNNSRRGAIGPFQVLRIAFDHMKKIHPTSLKSRHYTEMLTDTKLNEEVACMYLLYIYNGRANKNWNTTVMMYNAGPWGALDSDARSYLKKVKKYGDDATKPSNKK